ncbi:hypothetical protein BVRB_5g110050 [Beta vulgaris subsp. vulgaris]|nr:hypothetical protein BVRB_5g110050 [Beta vulgaris subsp. vulgaris]
MDRNNISNHNISDVGHHRIQVTIASLMIIIDHYQIVIVAKKIEEKWRNKSDGYHQIINHHPLVLQYYDQDHLKSTQTSKPSSSTIRTKIYGGRRRNRQGAG